ncbi:MAG: family 65 glycosyl hydrolase [Clostridiales bacterium]|jgi:maltose phosphorylase|nr:family 65 glycosyl hydrolase [Clostridiales bacterium]
MPKFADRYFKIEPWRVVEDGFNPMYSTVAESIFSLGNEHIGLRGYFEEGYSGERLQGSYVNGIYESAKVPHVHYKGVPDTLEFMVNAADWVRARISCNGQLLDLARSAFSDFSRVLDMHTGELTRSFVWHVNAETDIKMTFSRVLSMERLALGASRIDWRVLRGDAELDVEPEVLFSDHWEVSGEDRTLPDFYAATGTTKITKQKLYVSVFYTRSENSLTRVAHISKTERAGREALSRLTYDEILSGSRAWWKDQWAHSDIEVELSDGGVDGGDQQGIRYCVFQMHQTVHSGKDRVVIGAKGLTGEAYNGNTFWEAELYFLPFYLFTNPEAATGILQFRYETLGEAKKRAKELDCEGAFYPIATISGRESCTLWQHANTQLQVSTSVAYALWHHAKVTGDETFLREKGIDELVEICRMLASRGGYDPVSGEYGYYGVMGPDEFQLMVNHNRYTNYMAKKTLLFTLETLAATGAPETGEHRDWRRKADAMRVGFDEKTLLYEQHDGYFRLPHVDIKSIPAEDFPLYHHWSYDRIYRNDIIKQPDVLMFMSLYASEFSDAQLAANYDYYEPRCTHESSLSPSIHSILACRLGKIQQAYEFFRFTSRIDLDNYNRNTNEGLHLPSIAGSWMNIVYGFAGLRSDGDILSFDPILPEEWKRLRFPLRYRGSLLRINITRNGVRTETKVTLEGGPAVTVKLNGEDCRVR